MDKIKIGDIVLCINSIPFKGGIATGLIKGNEYCVLDIEICKCGTNFIYVGTTYPNASKSSCMTCGHSYIVSKGNVRFYSLKRFVKSKRQINKAIKKNENLFVKLEPKKVLEPLIFINN